MISPRVRCRLILNMSTLRRRAASRRKDSIRVLFMRLPCCRVSHFQNPTIWARVGEVAEFAGGRNIGAVRDEKVVVIYKIRQVTSADGVSCKPHGDLYIANDQFSSLEFPGI